MKLSLGLLVSSLALSVAGFTALEPRQFSNDTLLIAAPDCAVRLWEQSQMAELP